MTCTPTEKVCTICRQPRDKNQFNKHGGHKDGLGSNCRTCIKELARMRRLNISRTPKAPKIKVPKLKIVVPINAEIAVSMHQFLRSKIAARTIGRFALKAHWMEASSVSCPTNKPAPPVKASGPLSVRWRRTKTHIVRALARKWRSMMKTTNKMSV